MIRNAEKSDGAQIIPLVLIILADMELPFLTKYGYQKTQEILAQAYLDETFRYSYRRALVLEEQGEIVGVAYGYLAEAEQLIDLPLTDLLSQFEIDSTEKMFHDLETFPDEWYLDSIAVRDDQRGRGVGSKLLAALPDFARANGAKRIGLNVDEGNPQAKKLYLRHGFEVVGEIVLSGHQYEHLQKEI